MIFAPTGSATAVPLVIPQTQTAGNIGVSQPIGAIVPSQFSQVFTNSTPMATYAQGGFMTGFPAGWDPSSSLGMPSEFMIPSTMGQASLSASQLSNLQITASSPQPTQPQDSTLAPQPAAPIASASQSTDPTNMSAAGPTPHQNTWRS